MVLKTGHGWYELFFRSLQMMLLSQISHGALHICTALEFYLITDTIRSFQEK